MFDRLVDLFLQFIGLFKFWTVVRPYENKALYRMGKLKRIFTQGWYFMWPFKIDETEDIRVDKSACYLLKQSITTDDMQTVTVKSAVIWRVLDVIKIAIEINDVEDVLASQCAITVAERVKESTWQDICTKKWRSDLSRAVTMKTKLYGIEVLEFEIIELVKTDVSARIFNE